MQDYHVDASDLDEFLNDSTNGKYALNYDNLNCVELIDKENNRMIDLDEFFKNNDYFEKFCERFYIAKSKFSSCEWYDVEIELRISILHEKIPTNGEKVNYYTFDEFEKICKACINKDAKLYMDETDYTFTVIFGIPLDPIDLQDDLERYFKFMLGAYEVTSIEPCDNVGSKFAVYYKPVTDEYLKENNILKTYSLAVRKTNKNDRNLLCSLLNEGDDVSIVVEHLFTPEVYNTDGQILGDLDFPAKDQYLLDGTLTKAVNVKVESVNAYTKSGDLRQRPDLKISFEIVKKSEEEIKEFSKAFAKELEDVEIEDEDDENLSEDDDENDDYNYDYGEVNPELKALIDEYEEYAEANYKDENQLKEEFYNDLNCNIDFKEINFEDLKSLSPNSYDYLCNTLQEDKDSYAVAFTVSLIFEDLEKSGAKDLEYADRIYKSMYTPNDDNSFYAHKFVVDIMCQLKDHREFFKNFINDANQSPFDKSDISIVIKTLVENNEENTELFGDFLTKIVAKELGVENLVYAIY